MIDGCVARPEVRCLDQTESRNVFHKRLRADFPGTRSHILAVRGCRPLTPIEIQAVAREFARSPVQTRFRNVALWFLMHKTGLRITEALSLSVGDVSTGDAIRSHLRLRRAATKGAKCGATLPLHAHAARALRTYIRRGNSVLQGSSPLFPSANRRSVDAKWCVAIPPRSH